MTTANPDNIPDNVSGLTGWPDPGTGIPTIIPTKCRDSGGTGAGYLSEHLARLQQCRVAQTLIPALSQREKEEDSEVLLVGRLREAIRWLNPAIPIRTFATLRDWLLPKLRSGELSVGEVETNR